MEDCDALSLRIAKSRSLHVLVELQVRHARLAPVAGVGLGISARTLGLGCGRTSAHERILVGPARGLGIALTSFIGSLAEKAKQLFRHEVYGRV